MQYFVIFKYEMINFDDATNEKKKKKKQSTIQIGHIFLTIHTEY